MSKFIYKQTNDKVYHIYLDDPSKEGFTKVGQAKSISFIKEHNSKYILLFNDDGLTKRLFGIIENKIFQVTIPKNSKVLIFDSICVYEKDSIWYTMVLKKDAFEELLLGEKHEIYLGCPEKNLLPKEEAKKIKYQDMHVTQMSFMDEYFQDVKEIESEMKQRKTLCNK